MMNRTERARMGGLGKGRNREPARIAFLGLLAIGHRVKYAAWLAGISRRTASRYRKDVSDA